MTFAKVAQCRRILLSRSEGERRMTDNGEYLFGGKFEQFAEFHAIIAMPTRTALFCLFVVTLSAFAECSSPRHPHGHRRRPG